MAQGLPDDFEGLSYAEKRREMLAFYRRVGYDPVEQANESRLLDLEEANRRLREEVGDLAEQLRVLQQDYQVELANIRLNLAEHAQLAVAHALIKQAK